MDIVKIEFNSDILDIIQDDIQWVAIKAVTNNLGIKFDTQHKKLKTDKTYQSKLIKIKTAGGVQNVFCIPLSKLNGWLFSINPNKVKQEVKDKLIEYKNECFDVLYKHFNKTPQNDQIKQLQDIIMAQNKLIADNSKPTNKPDDIFMNDSALHNNFLEFLFQANKAVHEVNIIRHLSPGLDTTHQSLSNFMLHITRRYEKIKGVDKYKVPQIELK